MKFIPKYITTDILAEYGEHLTHEAYNEMVILNSTQGDYNTKILNQLFNTDEGIQIPYLDNKIKKVTDDQLAINEDMDQVVADMKALAGSLSKYTTICETRRMIQNATQGFVKTNKLKAGDNVDITIDALNNVTISATGGVAIEYVDERDAATLSAANNYTDNAIAQIDLSDYATTQYVDDAIAQIDLDDYATKDYVDNAIADIPIPVVPTNVSAFTNDAGYITSHDIPPMVESDPYFSASPAARIQTTDITAWNNKSDFSGDYNDLTNKPDLTDYYTKTETDSLFNNTNSTVILNPSYTTNDPLIISSITKKTLYYNNRGASIFYLKGTPDNTTTKSFTWIKGCSFSVVADYNKAADGDLICIYKQVTLSRSVGANKLDYSLLGYIKDTNETSGFKTQSLSNLENMYYLTPSVSKPTITGLWTFNQLPESSVVPTTANQLVNKAYIDDIVGNIEALLGGI